MESKKEKEKEFFNDLLSRLDTLHDFCDPSADRNKDKDPSSDKNIEFKTIFNKEITDTMDKEIKIKDTLSQAVITKNIESIIDTYIKASNINSFYKLDLYNLITRSKRGGLVLINDSMDIERFKMVKTKITNFEPSVVVFFEFLYNISIGNEKINNSSNIGTFISNKHLPIYDYINKNYKIFADGKYTNNEYKENSNGTYKYEKINIEPFNIESKQHLNQYIDICKINKENIITFILGKINDGGSDDKIEKSTGFYEDLDTQDKSKLSKKDQNTLEQNLYFRYLSHLRYILGKYFGKEDNVVIYLIVDTSNIPFSKYYNNISDVKKKEINLIVLCNTATNWDGANSASCLTKQEGLIKKNNDNNINEQNITDLKTNKSTRSIYDIDSIVLKDIPLKKNLKNSFDTFVKFDNDVKAINIKLLPRTVADLSECIRQKRQNRKFKQSGTKDICERFKTKGRLLDIKRTGDALQALMTSNLNQKANELEFYIFVTLDHLAFLKARINGIPTIYTQIQYGDSNRIIVLFNNNFEKNYKAISSNLKKEYNIFNSIDQTINNIKNLRFSFILDFLTRVMFGIVLVIRPNEKFTNYLILSNDKNKTDNIILLYLKTLLNVSYKNKFKYQYYKPYKALCFLKEINEKITTLEKVIEKLNNKTNESKKLLIDMAFKSTKKIILTIDKPSEIYGLIKPQSISDYINKYIVNSFIIECFYCIKRSDILNQYFNEKKEINNISDDTESLINKFNDIITNNIVDTNGVNYDLAMKYTQIFRFFNKKYETLYVEKEGKQIFDIFTGFINNDYNYSSEDITVKNDIKNLFGLDLDEYTNIMLTISDEIENIYKYKIEKPITEMVNNFSSEKYFEEPKQGTRSSLSVDKKMKNCEQFFIELTPDPNEKEKEKFNSSNNMRNILYKNISLICVNFYKNKMANLHMSKITSTAIIFDIAMKKIIEDELIVRVEIQNEKIRKIGGYGDIGMGIETENNNIKNHESIELKNNEPIEIDKNIKSNIKSIFNLLDIDSIYDKDRYNKDENDNYNYNFTESDLANRKIYTNYKFFLNSIYLENANLIPKIMSIEEDIYNNLNLPEKYQFKSAIQEYNGIVSLDFIKMNNYLLNYMKIEEPIYDEYGEIIKDISNITYDMKFQKIYDENGNVNMNVEKNLQEFIYVLVSELLKQNVDNLFNIIRNFYENIDLNSTKRNINNTSNSHEDNIINKLTDKKDDGDPIYIMIIWMMINDSYMLLEHPNRIDDWKEKDKLILESILNKDTGRNIDTYTEDNINNMKKQKFGGAEIDNFSDYITRDEYIYTKCIFEDNNFLLKTNIGILACINSATGKLNNNINIYSPEYFLQSQEEKEEDINENENKAFYNKVESVLQKKLEETNEKQRRKIKAMRQYNRRRVQETVAAYGGNLMNQTLANYYKKYYSTYYNIYYKN